MEKAKVSEAAIRKDLADKIAESMRKLNKEYTESCKSAILENITLQNEFLNEEIVLADFKEQLEANQARLFQSTSTVRETLTGLKEQEISILKSEIEKVRKEQEQVNAEIDELVSSLNTYK